MSNYSDLLLKLINTFYCRTRAVYKTQTRYTFNNCRNKCNETKFVGEKILLVFHCSRLSYLVPFLRYLTSNNGMSLISGRSCDFQDGGAGVEVSLWRSPEIPTADFFPAASTLGSQQVRSAATTTLVVRRTRSRHQLASPASLSADRGGRGTVCRQHCARQICRSTSSSVNSRPACSNTSSVLSRRSHLIDRRHCDTVLATLAPYTNAQTQLKVIYQTL